MQRIADFFFEAFMLKALNRSGYSFLGSGRESVAEHSFMISIIAYAMSRMAEGVDREKLICMCLLHDLPEARMGDLNYVQKNYVFPDEHSAVRDFAGGLPFEGELLELLKEFNEGKSLEARLARDADQLAFIVDLKALMDTGRKGPEKWINTIEKRLLTDMGKTMAKALISRDWDSWWLDAYKE